jgi:hypothetical protein
MITLTKETAALLTTSADEVLRCHGVTCSCPGCKLALLVKRSIRDGPADPRDDEQMASSLGFSSTLEYREFKSGVGSL